MPRTKKPMKKREKSTEGDVVSKSIDKFLAEQILQIKSQAAMEKLNVELAFTTLLGHISKEHLNMTIGELRRMHTAREEQSTATTISSSHSALNDDGYITEKSTESSSNRDKNRSHIYPPPTGGRMTRRRSRSAEPSSRKVMLSAKRSVQRRLSRSVYRTPAYNMNAPFNYPPITPKVNPQTPLTVLRQPRQGEMVVSMSGSPVVVPTCYSMQPNQQANCNIVLQDGTTLSVQPKKLRESQACIPFNLMAPGVIEQIETLKNNLDTVLRLGKKTTRS